MSDMSAEIAGTLVRWTSGNATPVIAHGNGSAGVQGSGLARTKTAPTASTPYLTRLARGGFANAGTANTSCGVIISSPTFFWSNNRILSVRFAMTDTTQAPNSYRLLVGAVGTLTQCNGNPSADSSSYVAFGLDSTDVNIQLMYRAVGKGGVATKIDTGFPRPQSGADNDVFEVLEHYLGGNSIAVSLRRINPDRPLVIFDGKIDMDVFAGATSFAGAIAGIGPANGLMSMDIVSLFDRENMGG